LEMSSGLGAISAKLAEEHIPIYCSDQLKENRDKLRATFEGIEAVRDVYNIDFGRPDFLSVYARIFGKFGTMLALNVLEGGYFNPLELQNAWHFLHPRGRLILIAPAYTSMFYGLEQDPEGWSRYNYLALTNLLKGKFEIIRTWFLSISPDINNSSLSSLGLSVLAVTRKL
jgi:hypothetical protein